MKQLKHRVFIQDGQYITNNEDRSLLVKLGVNGWALVREDQKSGYAKGCFNQVELTSFELREIIRASETPLPRARGWGRLLQGVGYYFGYDLNLSNVEASAEDGLRPVIITRTKDRRVTAVTRRNGKILVFEEYRDEMFVDLEYCGY